MSDLEKMKEKYLNCYEQECKPEGCNDIAHSIYESLSDMVHEEVKGIMKRLIDAEKNIEKLEEKCEVNRVLIKEGYIENFKKVIEDCVNKNK